MVSIAHFLAQMESTHFLNSKHWCQDREDKLATLSGKPYFGFSNDIQCDHLILDNVVSEVHFLAQMESANRSEITWFLMCIFLHGQMESAHFITRYISSNLDRRKEVICIS